MDTLNKTDTIDDSLKAALLKDPRMRARNVNVFYGDNKAIDNVFNELMNEKAIVKVNQHNGDAMIFGSKTSPLEVNYSFLGSKKVDNSHKFKIKISGKTLQKPVFL